MIWRRQSGALTIQVTVLPLLGRITLADGTPLSLNRFLTTAQLTGLKYDAPADYNGSDDVGRIHLYGQ